MLSQARTLVERETAIQFAMDHGMPLSDIERHLDRIDAGRQHESANNAANQPTPLKHLSQGEHPASDDEG
jgi:DNA-binding transcriptional MerR regulator